jgi:hypothetical protein
MNPNLTDIIVIMDKSGSMDYEGKWGEAVTSFRHFVDSQMQLPGKANITLTLFDDRPLPVLFRKDLRAVTASIIDNYQPMGMTALLDALGSTIDSVGAALNDTPEAERPALVSVAVITDGLENNSVSYTHAQVKKLVEQQRDVYGWRFNFFGAGIDAFTESQRYGFTKWDTYAVRDSNKGIADSFTIYSTSLTTQRTSEGSSYKQQKQGDGGER